MEIPILLDLDGPASLMPQVEVMPHAHNGYLDVRLETGLIGFALFVSLSSQPSTRLGAWQTATRSGMDRALTCSLCYPRQLP
jgi:O-antigen ligase